MQVIQRHYLSPKKITIQHVIASLGVDISRDHERVMLEKQKLQKLKNRANCFFGISIQRMMREEARKREMIDPETGSIVSKFRCLGREFSDLVTDKTASDLFAVCYGIFDLCPNWAKDLESEFMKEECLDYAWKPEKNAYKRGPPEGTGILSLIYDKKSENVKLVMERARQKHGYYLSIRINSAGEKILQKRRKKGVYDSQFLRRDKAVESTIVDETKCTWKKDLRTVEVSPTREQDDFLDSRCTPIGNDFFLDDDVSSILSVHSFPSVSEKLVSEVSDEEKRREARSENIVKKIQLQNDLKNENETSIAFSNKTKASLEALIKDTDKNQLGKKKSQGTNNIVKRTSNKPAGTPKTRTYRTDNKNSEEDENEDEESDDYIVEIIDIFLSKQDYDNELLVRVKWRFDGIQNEPYLLVKQDDPEAVECFLLLNKHLNGLVKESSVVNRSKQMSRCDDGGKEVKDSVSVDEEMEQNNYESNSESTKAYRCKIASINNKPVMIECPKATEQKKRKISDKNNNEEKQVVEEETTSYHCCLDHQLLQNLKMEIRGGYFNHPNSKYYGTVCQKCSVPILQASTAKPVYICVNENHGCLKSICHSCMKDIVCTTGTSKKRRLRGSNN